MEKLGAEKKTCEAHSEATNAIHIPSTLKKLIKLLQGSKWELDFNVT
jgi:hypothetical protein